MLLQRCNVDIGKCKYGKECRKIHARRITLAQYTEEHARRFPSDSEDIKRAYSGDYARRRAPIRADFTSPKFQKSQQKPQTDRTHTSSFDSDDV